MEDEVIIDLLNKTGIRPTAARVLIYKFIMDQEDAFSLRDVEDELLNIDKSTIFRTLILFEEHSLIHRIDDGSGSMKYCLCINNGACEEEEFHSHFYCEVCKKTYCLDKSINFNVSLPDGFTVNQINYIIKGVCDKCSLKKR